MREGMKLGTQRQRRGGQWDQREERRSTPDALGRWVAAVSLLHSPQDLPCLPKPQWGTLWLV